MLRVKGGIASLASLLAAAALALAGVPALADGVGDRGTGTADVVVDYRVDAVIDSSYPVATLRDALADHQDDAGFAAAVEDALDEALLGTRTSSTPVAAPIAIAPTPPVGAGEVPLRRTQERTPAGVSPPAPPPASVGGLGLTEPTPGTTSALPWPFLALSALAGLLAVSGLAASLYRRARRPSRLTPTP